MGLDDDRPDQRDSDRPEDREDDTDQAIKLARSQAITAVEFLAFVMRNRDYPIEDRTRCAIALLEVSGCL